MTVIVPAHNAAHLLPRCLAAIAASTMRDFEIIVVDDASSDDTSTVAAAHGARCFRTARRLGPGGARNLAAGRARGEILAFIDADVAVHGDSLGRLYDALRDGVAAAFGSYDDSPAEPGFFSQYKNLLHHYVHQHSTSEASTFWSGCGAIRKAVFQKLGGFNVETYPDPSIEDIDLGMRIRQAGYRVKLDKRVQATHLKGWTPLQLFRCDIRNRAIPWARLILQTGYMPRELNLSYASRLCVMLTLLLATCLAAAPLMHRMGSSLLFALAALASGMLLALNGGLYRFFLKRHGVCFALATIPLHWLYFFYSGVALIYCCVEHAITRLTRRAPGVASPIAARELAGREWQHRRV